MQASDDVAAFTAALLAQLNAEIAAIPSDPKKFSAVVGIDYNTFRRYLKGEREMPMHVFWMATRALPISEDEFLRRARQRLAAG